jgi:hypothetical protein
MTKREQVQMNIDGFWAVYTPKRELVAIFAWASDAYLYAKAKEIPISSETVVPIWHKKT